MKIISLVPERFEDGGWSGVPRFDWELRQAFPDLISLRTSSDPKWWWKRHRYVKDQGNIVITGNENSLRVPRRVRTIVVHHGCAQTHFDRDPTWRGLIVRKWCRAQQKMYRLPNRWYVALARWTAQEFSRHYGVPLARIIPSWVAPLQKSVQSGKKVRPVVIGDWRTYNKGQGIIAALQKRLPEIEFRSLQCTYQTRAQTYQEADGYLCLSLSEGGSFSLSDAEAAKLAIVTTDVGNCLEYDRSYVIPWERRDDLDLVAATIQRALTEPRGPSFFEIWTLDRWKKAWHDLVEEVMNSTGCGSLVAD